MSERDCGGSRGNNGNKHIHPSKFQNHCNMRGNYEIQFPRAFFRVQDDFTCFILLECTVIPPLSRR